MDGTTLIKVEENYFNHSYSGDASAASSASGSPQTLLHRPEDDPPKIETTAGRVVKIKKEQSHEEKPVQNHHKKATIPSHSLGSRDLSEYRCELCTADGEKLKLYANKRALRRHMTDFHSSTPRFKCQVCSKQFNNAPSFKRHSCLHLHTSSTSRVQDVIEYRCEQCLSSGKKLKLYAHKNALKVHTDKVHQITPRFKCQICFKPFNCPSNFKRHTLTHSNQTSSFKCKVCLRAFTTKAGLNLHLVSKHNYNSTELNVKVFPCDLCSHVSFGKSLYERHVVETHVVDKPLECRVCSKTFIDQEALSKHLKGHEPRLRHVCDVCSKTFANKYTLLDHLGIAHKKFFYCGKCKKSFSNKSEFEAHLELLSQHEFSCQICSQPFQSQCSLSLHIGFHNLTESQNQDSDLKGKKIENNSDEFKCKICLKTFDREAYIAAHRKLVHPVLEWQCSKCSRTFKYRYQIKTHELTHQGKKARKTSKVGRLALLAQEPLVFKCNLCSFESQDDKEVAAHYNSHGLPKIILFRQPFP